MNTLVLRRLALIAGIPWVAIVACGGRSGLDFIDSVDGTGQGGAFGGTVGTGAATNGAARGNGGRVGVAGTAPGGRPVPGTGGFVSSGGFGFGGVPPGFGGTTSTGGQGCDFPACNCGSCLDNCFCRNVMGPAGACFLECGITGAGGSGGAGGSPAVCLDPTMTTQVVCGSTLEVPLPTCCTDRGVCGIQLDLGQSPPNLPADLPFVVGCQEQNQAGTLDARCPDLGTLSGTTQSGPPGCCRPDGTCGIDISPVNLGCLQSLKGGFPIACSTGIVDAGPDVVAPPVDAGNRD